MDRCFINAEFFPSLFHWIWDIRPSSKNTFFFTFV